MAQDSSVIVRLKQSSSQTIGEIKRVVGLMPAKFMIGLIDELDLEANPRSSKLGSVTAAIQDSISADECGEEELFPFKSKGILIAASSFEQLDRDRYKLRFIDRETEGILDGGHNTLAIGAYILAQAEQALGRKEPSKKSIQIWDEFKKTWCDLRDDIDAYLLEIHERGSALKDAGVSTLDFQIPVELLLPMDADDELCVESFRNSLLEICAARNNNAQLTQGTKGNKEGLFDSLRGLITEVDPVLADKISWKTNDGGRIDVKTIAALSWIPLSLTSWVSGEHKIVDAPSVISVYSGKDRCLTKYLDLLRDDNISAPNGGAKRGLKDPEVMSALKVAADLPALFDKIYRLFPSCYRGSYGKINAVKGLMKKDGGYKTPFMGWDVDKPVPDGFIYPLVYGLRAIMKRDAKSGQVAWRANAAAFVDSDEFRQAVAEYSGVISQSDYDPQKVGKGSFCYTAAENAIKLHYLQWMADR